MHDIRIRTALRSDLPRLTEIYNHYVTHTPITFDLAPHAVEARIPWFEQFATSGRQRLLVAEEDGIVVGYAGTMRFRDKAAYETSVETTVYCSHDSLGHGIGSRLYAALFEAIAGEDIHRIIGGYTLPNPATLALHERFGSSRSRSSARQAANSDAIGTWDFLSDHCGWMILGTRRAIAPEILRCAQNDK